MQPTESGICPIIIGGGPAGISAAWEMARHGVKCSIIEKDWVVGGLSRTVVHNGCRFDIGGHRFYTKVALLSRIWREILGEDFLRRPRLSRIFYRGRFFRYPLDPWDTLAQLGAVEAARCFFSYCYSHILPPKSEASFEDWVVKRFGWRLYRTFFQTYTEKVWGMPCSEISADWASQRIRGLNFVALVKHALFPASKKGVKSLIEEFDYPRLGPGMMWERMMEQASAGGAGIEFGCPVDRIHWRTGKVLSVESKGRRFEGTHFLSTMPIRDLFAAFDPAPPKEVMEAATRFRYRDFLTVALKVAGENPFPDNWIYIHSPEVKVGRVQNYRNWSPDMVEDPAIACLGMEYFCFQGDGMWEMQDSALVELATREATLLGLIEAAKVREGVVVRMAKAYPIYDDIYRDSLLVIAEFLKTLPNLQLAGRNGMHRYNNQDHSMLTGILAARNIMGAKYDLWSVNVDEDYVEETGDITGREWEQLEAWQPMVPQRLRAQRAISGD